jgi:hypothetical protein
MDYISSELAHRQRDELLLWDGWGAMADQLPDDLTLIDTIAALLVAADSGGEGAEVELAARYRTDPRLHSGAPDRDKVTDRRHVHRRARHAGGYSNCVGRREPLGMAGQVFQMGWAAR